MGMIIGMTVDEMTVGQRAFMSMMLSAALAGGGAPPSAGPPDPPVAMGVGPYFDEAPLAIQEAITEFWPQDAWEKVAAIGYIESGWNPDAHNTNGEDSRGWLQINVVPQANIDLLAVDDPFTVRGGSRLGSIVWSRQGWRAWLNSINTLGIEDHGPGVI